MGGQRLAQRRVGVDKRRTRKVQPHEFHQHLVGVCGAVEGAGANAMIAGHLCRHQRLAPNLAGGKRIAHAGFFVVRQAARHWPRGHEHRRNMTEGGRSHHQTGHDLVADAQEQRRVKGVMRQRNPCGECDHVAREQRKLHPGLTLGNSVAHRRNPAGHLRRGPHLARRSPDQFWVIFIRLMRRQHVVIGGHDANIGRPRRRQRVFVHRHGCIGMGLIAAGQMPARRPCFHRCRHPRQIIAARLRRAFADPVGHTGDS